MRLPTLTLLLVTLACGCSDDRPISDGPAPALAEPLTPTPVNFSSTDLAESTRVGTVNQMIDGNGVMHVSVPIRAVTGGDITVDTRFTWLDDRRMVIDQPASWQARTLHAGTFEYIDATAPGPAAKAFVLDLRYAQ